MDYSMLFNFAGNLRKKPSKFLQKTIAILAVTFVFLSVNSLNAQAPANDNCGGALPVFVDSPVLGNTESATVDNEEVCGTGDGTGGGVWYSFTPAASGDYKITTCAAATDYDTKVRVYSGLCDALVCVSGDDDESSDPLCTHSGVHSMALANLTGGEEYSILVHGFGTSDGNFELLVQAVPPVNDLCEGALPLLVDVPVSGNTELATADNEDFCGTSDGSTGVWYTFDAPTDDEYVLSLCSDNTNYDTKLRIYSGDCDALVCEAGTDDGGDCPDHSELHSIVNLFATAGTEYMVLVHGFGSNAGDFELLASLAACTDVVVPTVTCTDYTNTFDDCPDGLGANTPNGLWSPIGIDGGFNSTVGGSYTTFVDVSTCVSDDESDLADIEYSLFDSYTEDVVFGCTMTIVNEYVFRDECGNISPDHVFLRATIEETSPTPPSIDCPASIAVECGESTDPADTGMAVGDSDCGNVDISFADVTTPTTDCPAIEIITRTWTATNGCGVTSTCEQFITIEDNVPPVLVPTTTPLAQHECTTYDVLTLASYALGTLSSTDSAAYADYVLDLYLAGFSPISNDDACGDASIVFDRLEIEYPENPIVPGGTITEADCPVRARFTLFYYSTDGCNDTEMFSVTIEAIDTIAPEITLFPEDITIECSELDDQSEAGVLAYLIATYDASDVAYSDNCVPFDNLTLTQELGLEFISVEFSSNFDQDCPIVGTCSKTLTVTDGCNEVSETFTVTIIDTEAPVFEDFDETVMVECLEDVPAILDLTAEDCGVTINATSFGSNTGEIVSSCELTDAVGGFATWSLWLPVLDEDGLTSSANFVWNDDGGLFECYADGTARLTGTVVNDINPAESFDLDFWFENRADWTTWSTNVPARSYKDDLDCAEPTSLYEAWDYYELVGGISHAIGQGVLTGSTLSFYHDPASFYFGFQVGEGANNKNCNEGMSGWFTYTGLVDGQQVTGNGDINVDADCEEVNEVDCANHTEFKYTYRAVDDCGNAAWACQTILVDDVTPPTFTTFPADENISCENWPLPVGDVVADDNCIGDVTISEMVQDSTAGTCPHSFVITRTWRATDLCDNFLDMTQTITVVDETPPVMDGLPEASIDVECDAIPDGADVTATDNCSLPENITIDMTDVSTIDVDGPCDYTITRTWTATDECMNSSETFTQTINVTDTEGPVFDPYDVQVDVECDELMDFTITAMDNCNGATVTYTEVLGSGGCSFGVYTRIYTAVDACGNSTEATQYITVVDTTPPTFTVFPDDAAYQCSDDVPVAASPEGEDNCDDAPVIVYVGEMSDGESCPETITRTWTITDDCENVTTMAQTIIVDDTMPPTWDFFPEDLTFECTDIVSDEMATAIDNCDMDVDVTMVADTTLGNCAGNYVITRTFTAVDNCENESVQAQTITIQDTTGPDFLTVPADATFECGVVIPEDLATAEDECSGPANISFIDYDQMTPWRVTGNTGTADLSGLPTAISLASGDEGFGGSIAAFTSVKAAIVSFDYALNSDDSGDFDYFGYSINGVETYVAGTEGPFTGSLSVDLAAGDQFALIASTIDGIFGAAFIDVTAISFEFAALECPVVDCFIREFTATDQCGNESHATQLITIDDNTPPVFDPLPADIDMSCDAISTEIDATATDTCDDEVTIVLSDTEYSGGCNGTIVRTYTATDDCGNEAEIQQIIHIYDDMDPFFTNFPVDAAYQCMDDVPTAEMLEGDDNCDDAPVIVYLGETAVGSCPTTITRTWTITDNCMNEHEMSQTIVVNDTIDPEFGTFPANADLECGDALPTEEPTATDNCGDPAISSEDIESGDSCVMIITRRWTATDGCGNTVTQDQTITISDTEAPVFTFIPESMDVDCNADVPMVMATAEDACDNGATVSHDDVIVGDNPNCYVLTRTWTVIDECNNEFTSPMTTVYTVMDNEAPTFDQTVADVNVQCPDPIPAFDVVTATDNCDDAVDVIMTSEVLSEDDCGNTVIEVTYNVMDDCGNAADPMTYTITVQDTTEPVFDEEPVDVEITCDDEIPAPLDLSATDNCGGEVIIEMEEELIGRGPTPGSTSDCLLSTPEESLFSDDWSLWFQSFPGDDLFYTTVSAYLTEFPGGIAHLTGSVESSTTGGGWVIDIAFQDGMNWTDWSALGRSYKDEFGVVGTNHVDWTYYIMTTGSATLTGTGIYAGSVLNLTHAPSSYYYGYQVGVAASGANGNFGSGGWFNFSGDLITNGGTPVTVDGAGDFAFDADCCLEYEIERTYTATDCSGNTATTSYNVIVGEGAINIPGCTDDEACNYDPSATNDDDSCLFENGSCDDGDLNTENDMLDAECNCAGTPIPLAPENDLCENAIPVDCGTTVSGTTTNATTDGNPAEFCGTTPGAPGVWYTFTATGTETTLSVCDAASYDTKINVYTGDCEILTCAGGNDDGSGCSGFSSELVLTTTDGVTYMVLVNGFNGATGDFDLTITCSDAVVPGCMDTTACNFDSEATSDDDSCTYPGCNDSSANNYDSTAGCDDGSCTYDAAPANDLFAGAIEIMCGDVLAGNNDFATDTDEPGTGGSGMWYSFTGDGSQVTFNTCSGVTLFDTKIGVYTGTVDALVEVAFNDDFCGLQSSVTITSVIDETYFIYINSFGATTGDFELVATCIADVVEGCTDSTACNYDSLANVDDGTCIAAGCLDSTAFNFDPSAACGNDDTCLYSPDNDLCANAEPIACGDVVDGTTAAAVIDGAPTDFCGTTPSAPGVWYTIVGTGTITDFSLCDQANYDTKINIYSGTCDALVCVDGNDDGTGCTGFSSFLSTFLDDGVTYYVYVNGFNNAVGEFTLSVTCNDPAPFIIVDLSVILEGPLQNTDNFEMLDHIRTEESFPLTEPYTELGYERATDGGETTTEEILEASGESAVVDWVLVELRNGDNPEETIETRAALLLKNGKIVSAHNGMSALYFDEPGVDYNSVVVVIKHRNHLGTCNSVPFQLTGFTEHLALDFTDPALEVVGDELGMGVVNGVRIMYAGDANHDGSVNPYDKNVHWRVENGGAYDYFYSKSDFNMDGAINPFDKNSIWRVNNGRSEQINN